MKNLIKTSVIFLFCLLLTKNVLADHKNTALLEILEDYVEEEDTLVIEFQKVFSLYRARKPGFVFDSDEFFKNNVLVSSFRFGNFVWAYKFCTRYSNVNINLVQLEKQIKSISEPDYNNFLKGFNVNKKNSLFSNAVSHDSAGQSYCSNFRFKNNEFINPYFVTQSIFDNVVNNYLNILQDQYDFEHGIKGTDTGQNHPSKWPDMYVCGVQILDEAINEAKRRKLDCKQILKTVKLEKGRLGIFVKNVSEIDPKSYGYDGDFGLIVGGIMPGHPADIANFKIKDIIISINGKKIQNLNSYKKIIIDNKGLSNLNIEVWREGAIKKLQVIFNPSEVKENIIILEKDDNKPLNQNEAKNFLSILANFTEDNPGTFDLDFAKEFNKVRDISKGKWNDKLSKNLENFRQYIKKFPEFINYLEEKEKIADEELKKKILSLRSELNNNIDNLQSWALNNVLDEKASLIADLSLLAGNVKNQSVERLEELIEGSKNLLSATGIEDKIYNTNINESKNNLFNPSSIYLFGNISGDGQNIYKNLQAKFSFENNEAIYCHSNKLKSFDNYLIVNKIREEFNELNSIERNKCSSITDIFIAKGNEITSDKLFEIININKLDIIAEITRTLRDEKFDELSFMKNAIKNDVLEGTRVGYGLLRVLEQGNAVCSVITRKRSLFRFESHQNVLIKQKKLLEVFGLDGEIKLNVETEEEAFKSLQRGNCGIIYGSSLSLGRVYLAANSAGYEVDFLPVWISQKEINIEDENIKNDKLASIQQIEKTKQNIEDQAKLDAEAEKLRKESAKNRQKDLREINGLRFMVLTDQLKNYIFNAVDFAFENSPFDKGYVNKYINQSFVDKDTRYSVFDPIIADIQKLAAEKWEITEKRINQIDFGIVEYNNRKLEGLIIETIVSSKNRIVGKYSEYCKRIHYMYDKDFEIWRKFKLSECADESLSIVWKDSSNFESLWIVY